MEKISSTKTASDSIAYRTRSKNIPTVPLIDLSPRRRRPKMDEKDRRIAELEKQLADERRNPTSSSTSSSTPKINKPPKRGKLPTFSRRVDHQGSAFSITLVQYGGRWIPRYGSRKQVLSGAAYKYGGSVKEDLEARSKAAKKIYANSVNKKRNDIAQKFGQDELTRIEAFNLIKAIKKKDGSAMDDVKIDNMLNLQERLYSQGGDKTKKDRADAEAAKEAVRSLKTPAERYEYLRRNGYTAGGASSYLVRVFNQALPLKVRHGIDYELEKSGVVLAAPKTKGKRGATGLKKI